LGNIEYPRYSHEDIARIAASFLSEHHPSETIPAPIEKIVDNSLKIDIVPIPGMHKAFDTDGSTTSDLEAIYVEEFVYDQRPGRYRFTLAHEAGHIVLHDKPYRSLKWDSLEEWKRTAQGIDEEQYRWLEWHANAFAGLVLVPPSLSKNRYGNARRRSCRRFPDPGSSRWPIAISWRPAWRTRSRSRSASFPAG
jgi:hypothetical protein